MFEYDVRARSAELLRQAEHQRLVREAVRGDRAARREADEREPDSPRSPADSHPRRFRFTRPA